MSPREAPRVPQKRKESPEQTEQVGEELKDIQLTAELLAQNIKAHHEKGTSYHVGMLGEKMKRIEDKYNSLIMLINAYILIPGGALSIGSLGGDVISPEKIRAFDFTL